MDEKPKIRILKKGVPKEDIPTAPRPKPENAVVQEPKEQTNPPAQETEITAQEIRTAPPTPPRPSEPKVKSENKNSKNYLLYGGAQLVIIAVTLFVGYTLWGGSIGSGDAHSGGAAEENAEAGLVNVPDFVIAARSKGYYTQKDVIRTDIDFASFLTDKGVTGGDANTLQRMAHREGLGNLYQGDKITAYHDTIDNKMKYLIVEPGRDPYNFFSFNMDDDVAFDKTQKAIEIRETSTAAIVGGNLAQTFNREKLDVELVKYLEDAFRSTFDFFELKDGDRFKMLYDREYINNVPGQIKEIKAIYFEVGDDKYFAFPDISNLTKDYYDETGLGLNAAFLKSPLEYGGVITSGFGLRNHPIQKYHKLHKGTDYAAPVGTPIQAVADGEVMRVSFQANGAGNYVNLRHHQGIVTKYFHMQRWADGIYEGMPITKGDVIGYLGNTGSSTGPHLHFEFHKDGQALNHIEQKIGGGGYIHQGVLNEFRQSIAELKDKLIKEVDYF